MATDVTFKCYGGSPLGPKFERSGVISLDDVVVNTTPNDTGGWNTATVTADLQREIYVDAAAAATAGIDPGWYEKVAGLTFRKQRVR